MEIEWERDMKTFKLTKAEAEQLVQEYTTPLLVISQQRVVENYRFLTEYLPKVKIFYAVKSNPAMPIIKTLAELGASFDVASDGEMLQLTGMGISADRMIYANPFKTPKGLMTAKNIGVDKFTYDSESEIIKMAKAVPGGKVLLRVRIDNTKALVDLNKKFGAAPEDVMRLLRLASDQGLDVAGLCFHVGSQSPNAEAHVEALQICRKLFDEAAVAGFNLRILDIGGGLPITSPDMDIDIVQMVSEINTTIEKLFPYTEIWAEPGRFICGTTMNLITSVIGTQRRNNQQWYFLDEGIYGTFSSIIFDHWDFELESFKQTANEVATFAGPSCDSLDVIFRDKLTPPLVVGDILVVPNCGAYTSASASEFNGFAKAEIIALEDFKWKY